MTNVIYEEVIVSYWYISIIIDSTKIYMDSRLSHGDNCFQWSELPMFGSGRRSVGELALGRAPSETRQKHTSNFLKKMS